MSAVSEANRDIDEIDLIAVSKKNHLKTLEKSSILNTFLMVKIKYKKLKKNG